LAKNIYVRYLCIPLISSSSAWWSWWCLIVRKKSSLCNFFHSLLPLYLVLRQWGTQRLDLCVATVPTRLMSLPIKYSKANCSYPSSI
jgi:hypothetical protein